MENSQKKVGVQEQLANNIESDQASGNSLDMLRDLRSNGAIDGENLQRVSEWLMAGPHNIKIFEDRAILEVLNGDDISSKIEIIELLGELGSYSVSMSAQSGPNGPFLAVDTVLHDFISNDMPNALKAYADFTYDVVWLRYYTATARQNGLDGASARDWAFEQMRQSGRDIDRTAGFMGAAQAYSRERRTGELDTEDYGVIPTGRVAKGLLGVFDGTPDERLLGYMPDKDSSEGREFMQMQEEGRGIDVNVGVLHGMFMMEYCHQMFGIDVADLTLEQQETIFRFLGQKDTKKTEKFVERLNAQRDRLDKKEYEILVEGFLATKFGDDFGDKLLDVAENTNPDISHEVLSKINDIRYEADIFSDFFADFDPELKSNIQKAIGERVTEILYTLDALNKSSIHSVTKELFDKYPKTVDKDEYIIVALLAIRVALEKINKTMTGAAKKAHRENGEVYQNGNLTMFSMGDDGDVLLKIRAEGSDNNRDETVEYGFGGSTEAQINFAVNVLGKSPVPIEIADEARTKALSIRIDREAKLTFDKDGNVTDRDNEAEQLNVALDVGGNYGDDMTDPNIIVGTVITVGNILRAEQLEKEGRGYHTSLDAKFGEKREFARLADYMSNLFTSDYSAQPDHTASLDQSVAQHISVQPGKIAA